MKQVKKILSLISPPDIIAVIGLFFIAFASYKVCSVLGYYITGMELLTASIILARAERK